MKSIMGYPITGPAVMARYDEVKRDYYCDQGGNFSTIIARWSDNGPDYFSGLLGRSSLLLATEPLYPLVVGRRWAIALGYIEGE